MKKNILMSTLVLILLSSLAVRAEVLFEGYYKVTQFNKHIGFIVQRNELDEKNKQFKTTSFLKLAKNGFDMTESLQATSTADLIPLKYSYMATDGKKSKTIDATISKNKLKAIITEDGKTKTVNKKVNKEAFLSSALYYMMLKSKVGLKTNSNFDFYAIAEETIDDTKGSSFIDKKLVTVDKLQLLKVTNKFAGSEYENLLTDKGEVYSSYTSASDIKSELVKNPDEATEGIKISSGVFEKIFGAIPLGKINPLFAK
jgi:opacity protein-like surface antigen